MTRPSSYERIEAFFEGMAAGTAQVAGKAMGELGAESDALGGNGSEADAALDEPDSPIGQKGAVVVCSTALNVARFTGSYLRIVHVLGNLAPEALRAFCALVELYLYLVTAM